MRSVWWALILGLITMGVDDTESHSAPSSRICGRLRRRVRSPVMRGKRCLSPAPDEGRINGKHNRGRGTLPAVTLETDPEHPSGLRPGGAGPDRTRDRLVSGDHRTDRRPGPVRPAARLPDGPAEP